MPQMAPMSWIFLSPFFMSIILLSICLTYFAFNILPSPSSFNKMKPNESHINMTW